MKAIKETKSAVVKGAEFNELVRLVNYLLNTSVSGMQQVETQTGRTFVVNPAAARAAIVTSSTKDITTGGVWSYDTDGKVKIGVKVQRVRAVQYVSPNLQEYLQVETYNADGTLESVEDTGWVTVATASACP